MSFRTHTQMRTLVSSAFKVIEVRGRSGDENFNLSPRSKILLLSHFPFSIEKYLLEDLWLLPQRRLSTICVKYP